MRWHWWHGPRKLDLNYLQGKPALNNWVSTFNWAIMKTRGIGRLSVSVQWVE